MEPLTAATTFATIVSLISLFKQERNSQTEASHKEFLEWLDTHRHEEIKNIIENTYHLQDEINQLLILDNQVIIQKLDSIFEITASLSSSIREFRKLALSVVPNAELSNQSIEILTQLVDSKAKEIELSKHLNGYTLQTTKPRSKIKHTEPRFLEDDLDKLVYLGLLTHRLAKSGAEFYRITRNTLRLIESIKYKKKEDA